LPYPQPRRTQFEPGLSILDLLANVEYRARNAHMQSYSLLAASEVKIFDGEEPSRSVDRK
jgi:hypothetical protein